MSEEDILRKKVMVDRIIKLKKEAVITEKLLDHNHDPEDRGYLNTLIKEINYLADCVYELEDARNNIL